LSFIVQEDRNNIKGGVNKEVDTSIDISVLSEKSINNGNISSSRNHLKEAVINNDHEDSGNNTDINSTQIQSKIKNVVSRLYFTGEISVSGNQKHAFYITT